jgi:hypothetical protein
MRYIDALNPLISLRREVSYVLDLPITQKLDIAGTGKNTYYGPVEIKNLYPIYTYNGSFVVSEFKPNPIPSIQGNPINIDSITDTISYLTYNSLTDFTNYYNDTYITSYSDDLASGTYTLSTSTQTISGTNSLTTNRTYTYAFSRTIFIVRGKELYVFENELNVNQDLFILGNGEVRIIDNSIT